MGDFAEQIRVALKMGMVWLDVRKEFESRYHMVNFEEFKSWIKQHGPSAREVVPANVIVFEKEISWIVGQSLWFSSPAVKEEVRVSLLAKGIDVDDEGEETLIMKDMK